MFSSLYAYRQRQSREPLEDWLTECLAATLKAMPGKLLREWISGTVGRSADILPLSSLSVTSQYHIPGTGRPDLVISLGGNPWIVFENKIAHHVDDQLDRYGKWLSSFEGDDLPWRAIIYITHITSPPSDFVADVWEKRFGGHIAIASKTWGRLARQLVERMSSERPDAHSRVLAESFLAMLTEKGMSDDFPTTHGFAALEVFLFQAVELENMVVRMWDAVCHAANSNKLAARQIAAWPASGCYSAMRYVQRAPANESGWTYLETGIWFPDLGRWWGSAELETAPRGPQAYIYFGNNDDVPFQNISRPPEGWQRPGGYLFTHRSIYDFPSDPDARASSILAWCRERSDDLRMFLVEERLTKF